MKKAIYLSSLVLAMMATSAMAQNAKVNTLNLGAEVPSSIQLGIPTISVSGGAIDGGGVDSDGDAVVDTFDAKFTVANSAVAGGQIYSLTWQNANITSNHKLKLTSQNGGLTFNGTAPSGFTTRIGYTANLYWNVIGSGPGAFLDLSSSTSTRTSEIAQTALSASLSLVVTSISATSLLEGTYSDTLTATITPTT